MVYLFWRTLDGSGIGNTPMRGHWLRRTGQTSLAAVSHTVNTKCILGESGWANSF